MGFTMKGKIVVVPSVPRLVLVARPLAIARFIVTVVVDTIQTCTWWLFAHISKEVGKCKPRSINFYTTPTVVGIAGIFRISATLRHSYPRMIGRCNSFAGRMTMLGASLYRSFLLQATARLCYATAKKDAFYDAIRTTFTAAKPLSLTFGVIFDTFKGRPSPESFACNIDRFHLYLSPIDYYNGFCSKVQLA